MRILVCSLNWGLGHASRDVPVIRKLVNAGHEVILAGDGMPLKMLETEFPHLRRIHFPQTFRISYFRHLPAWLKIFLLSPFLLYDIFIEHYRLKKVIRTHQPDMVISDNRYGLWSRGVKSILITHQCSIRLPVPLRFLELPAALVLNMLIEKFDRCWIPDHPGKQNLSGDLSHRFPLPANAEFIGPLSRFSGPAGKVAMGEKPWHKTLADLHEPILMVLLSGPEPQRTRLEKIILKQIPDLEITTLILQGLPGNGPTSKIGPQQFLIPHLPTPLLHQTMQKAGYIICRSGYSSIMDLVNLQKKAMLIPTPGQTEQEYLANRLNGKGTFLSCRQKEIDLQGIVPRLEQFEPVFAFPVKDYLTNLLSDL